MTIPKLLVVLPALALISTLALSACEKKEAAPAASAGKILYYRNPMGLADTSPTPKKDSMGMDYVPVYAEDATHPSSSLPAGTVSIPPARIQQLGVETVPVVARNLVKTLSIPAVIKPQPGRQVKVTPRFGGYVDKVFVGAAGETVKKGQPLMTLYSQELVQSQTEYRLASLQGWDALAKGARQKLKDLDVPAPQLDALANGGEVSRKVVWPSPLKGVVLSASVVTGSPFTAGTVMYEIADLSEVRAVGNVPEQDLPGLKAGQAVILTSKALAQPVSGTLALVAPVINPATRTAEVRVVLKNSDFTLKPDMFMQMNIQVPVGEPDALSVPESAVLENGSTHTVLVADGKGHFTPRPVQVGAKADGFVEITDGVFVGEQVVTRANFLIDAESNLKAALQTMSKATPETPVSGTEGPHHD